MNQKEAIKRALKLIKEPKDKLVTANISLSEFNGTTKTKCDVFVADTKGCIYATGDTFKECLFLLECKINHREEESQDDGQNI